MINRCHNKHGFAHGFTLVELLVAMAIVGLLTAIALVGMAGVTENARGDRTRAQIARIHSLIAPRWEEFESVRVNVRLTPPQRRRAKTPGDKFYRRPGTLLAMNRVSARREMMRMTLPERKSDLVDGPVMLSSPPGQWRALRRKAAILIANFRDQRAPQDPFELSTFLNDNWSTTWQASECLYLNLSTMVDGERSALEFLREDETGDLDQDGIPEILDAWGNPIMILRWAPGYNGVGSYQDFEQPDNFDPLNLFFDPSFQFRNTFQLFPLIFSAGPDKKYDIRVDFTGASNRLRYSDLSNDPMLNNDPFVNISPNLSPIDPSQVLIGGFKHDSDINDGQDNSADNITNHLMTTGR